MILKINTVTVVGLWLIFALLAFQAGPLLQIAYAAALTSKSDTMTSLKASTAGNHTILFTTPTGVASGETIILTLASFSIDAALNFEDMDLSSEASGGDGICDTGDTEEALVDSSPSTSQWTAVRTSATVITFTSGGASAVIAAGAEVCVEIGTNAEEGVTGVEQITNPTAGSYTLAIAGTMTDSGSIAIEILSDDQVAATATVDESLTFSISDNAIGFGTLTSSNARFATGNSSGDTSDPAGGAHTVTVGTNAASGYTMTVSGTTLTSGGNTIDAMATEAVSSAGTEQYGLRITKASGPGTVDTVYDDTPVNTFALVTGDFPDQVASATGASADTVYEMHYLANILSNTEAGSYTSTLTYTATATF